MDETAWGILGMIVLFILFGLPIAAVLFFMVIFYVLNSAVTILTRLGYAAIVPAGLYVLLDYFNNRKGRNGSQASPGVPLAPVSNGNGQTRGFWSGNPLQRLLPGSSEGSRSGSDEQGGGVR